MIGLQAVLEEIALRVIVNNVGILIERLGRSIYFD